MEIKLDEALGQWRTLLRKKLEVFVLRDVESILLVTKPDPFPAVMVSSPT